MSLNPGVRGELVGDGPGVAGHAGRGGVDLLEEQGEGAGDAGRGGRVEGDGDHAGRAGDGAAEVEQVAGDGPVFVVVAQVVVEPVAEPVLGGGGEQPQHHLQGPAPGAQDGLLRAGGDLAGGQLGGDPLERRLRCGDGLPGLGDLLLGGRDGRVLRGGGKVRGGEQGGELALGGGQGLLGAAQPGAGGLALGVGDQVVVVFGAGVVVAQPVDAVVVFQVLEQVLDPPPAAQPGQQRRGGRG